MNQSRAVGFALVAVLAWSTVATAFKLALAQFTPMQLLLVATCSAAMFLLMILAAMGRIADLFSQSRRTYFSSIGFALLNPVIYYVILFSAYAQLPAQEAQALNYTWAIVLTLMAVPMLGHRVGRFDLLAAVICYFGVLVIATRGELMALEFSNLVGVGLALLSTLIWSLYWILSRKDQRDPILGLTLNFLFAIPILVLVSWWSGDLIELLSNHERQGWLASIYAGVVEMGLGFVFWMLAMKSATSTTRIANLIFLSPFLSLFFIATFLGETIYASTIYGLLLIICGLIIQQKLGRKVEDSE